MHTSILRRPVSSLSTYATENLPLRIGSTSSPPCILTLHCRTGLVSRLVLHSELISRTRPVNESEDHRYSLPPFQNMASVGPESIGTGSQAIEWKIKFLISNTNLACL